jgi:hypothetical protein
MFFDQHHVVNFSGGACSFWAAHRVVKKYGPENVTLLFADTKMEDEDLYRFLMESATYLGAQLEIVCDGRTPWDLFEAEDMMGNSRVARCSKVLKQEVLDAWLARHRAEMTTTLHLGLDWTEGNRLERARLRLPNWRVEAPMMDEPIWDKSRMLCELTKIGIAVPLLYILGFPHNNCGGFCVKAGQAHFAHLFQTKPELYAFHEAKEQAFRDRTGKDVSIMKDRTGGETRPLTLRALRFRIEAGEEFDRLEWGGCGCSVDADREPAAAV